MISAIQNAMSGIKAAGDLQSTVTHNVANSNTDKFKSTVATADESDGGGVKVTLSKNNNAGTIYDKGDGTKVESSNVDIANEAVGQIKADHLLKANIASLKTSDEMMGNVIDILA